MSKKNRNRFRDREHVAPVSSGSVSPVRHGGDAVSQHAAEYKIISKDMIRLVALNGFMLAAVVILYYTNRSSGYLERFFEKFL